MPVRFFIVFGLVTIVLDIVEDVAEDLVGPLVSVDIRGEFGAVKLENGLGFLLVDAEALLDDFLVDIVEALFLEGPALEAVVDFALVLTLEVKDAADIDRGGEDFGLVGITGDAVEHEELDVGLETSRLNHGIDLRRPEVDGQVIGNELPLAAILEKSLAELGTDVDCPKDVAAGAVKETGDGAEDFALGALA